MMKKKIQGHYRMLLRRAFSSSAGKGRINELYCREQVQKQDYESFFIGLLWPRNLQRSYFAIKAFNVEIATIRDQVPKNVNNIARNRFQYWRDILQEIQQKKQLSAHVNQPVALELLECVRQHDLTVRWFERNLEARYTDISLNGRYEDYNGLEDYAEFSHSSIHYLLLELLGIRDHESPVMYAASHVGVANGLITLLRGHPFHVQSGMHYFPRQLMQQFSVIDNTILRGVEQSPEERESIRSISHDIASQAFAHMKAAREQLQKANSRDRSLAMKALLSAVNSVMYMEALEKHSFDPFLTTMEFNQKTPLALQYRVTKAYMTNSF